ncbi:MAG: response regulator [Thermodesulfobacteriota bacterium]
MQNLTILIVDDDPVIRRLLEQRLIKANYEVIVAKDGYEATRSFDQQHIDVVLTDLMMPGDLGGIDVLEIAKGYNSAIEVIVITAHSSVDSAVEAMKKGACDYLEKPINFDELFLRLEKISNMLSLFRNASDLRQAMDVTEEAAGRTIQQLEIHSSKLQMILDNVENILRSDDITCEERVEKALIRITENS